MDSYEYNDQTRPLVASHDVATNQPSYAEQAKIVPNQPNYAEQSKAEYGTPVSAYLSNLPPVSPPSPIQPYQSDVQTSNPHLEQVRREAEKTVKARQAFKTQIRSYIGAVLICVGIWLFTCIASGSFIYFWPFWVIVPWGIGLVAQYFSLYSQIGKTSPAQTEQEIQEEMRRRMGR